MGTENLSACVQSAPEEVCTAATGIANVCNWRFQAIRRGRGLINRSAKPNGGEAASANHGETARRSHRSCNGHHDGSLLVGRRLRCAWDGWVTNFEAGRCTVMRTWTERKRQEWRLMALFISQLTKLVGAWRCLGEKGFCAASTDRAEDRVAIPTCHISNG
ncbi:hypothetical protein BU25DRAFT_26326 [Macroventuria anomochaeta]|uniref:Uncharacterized protein n=1 Tax=Macroventuria anomochaeta TaxID=301207 RepID=A0ACB6S533_9PLEO|nr:uncharacterized protein BU25DRAFT_26326 [Macroventuria anomochaeta]KAF2629068.1 hypothetical protein BU25DRAFT_26326 [Macroventuria anomochaeta]